MSTVTIAHTAEAGTTIADDIRPHHGAVKALGWRWWRSGSCWYIPQSRDRAPQLHKIAAARAALEAVGFEVVEDIAAELRPVAEVEQDRRERAEGRAGHYEGRAEHLDAKAGELFDRAHQMADAIPFGQPILVGHYSEGRDRNYRARIGTTMDRAVSTHRDAEEAEDRAKAARSTQAHRESLGTTLRRIDRLETEKRRYERELVPCPASGKHFRNQIAGGASCPVCYQDVTVTDTEISVHGCATGRYAEECRAGIERLTAEVEYWRGHVAELQSSGARVFGPADFTKGDYYRGRKILRVNPKTLSVATEYSWADKIPYDRIRCLAVPAAEFEARGEATT